MQFAAPLLEPPRRPGHRGGGLSGLVLLLLTCLLTGCFVDTQRLPGPLPSRVEPLPPGSADLYPPGPEEALIIRHADPVQVRPAGMPNSFPVHFYRKQERVVAGAWVFTGAGGRAELLWPDGATARFFGTATAIVGSPSRGEASLIIRNLERLSVVLTEGRQIELMGGSVLVSDTGPFVIERPRRNILRIQNASKGVGRVAFREERFDLDPGSVFDLPLLADGGAPVAAIGDFESIDTDAGSFEMRGGVDIERDGASTRFVPLGEHELRGLGQRIRLAPGEELWVSGLGASPYPAGGPEVGEDVTDGASPGGDPVESPPAPVPETAPDSDQDADPGGAPEEDSDT